MDEEAEEDGRRPAAAPRAGPIRAGGVDGITRFDALSRFIGEQVRQVRLGQMTRADAWQAVVDVQRRR